MSVSFQAPSEPELAAQRAATDRSLRLPVLFFFTSAMFWLMVALAVGFVNSIQAFQPGFLAIGSRFEYPFTFAVGQIALIYGWGFNAAFGLSLWLTARMGRVQLKLPLVAVVGGHIWNIAITLGLLAILFGSGGSGVHLWEMPVQIWPALLAAFLVIASQVFGLFFRRENREQTYIAQWFVLGAWCWFAAAVPTTFLLVSAPRGSGVFATLVTSWYGDGLLYLWFTAIAIAAILYLVPKVSGRALGGEKILLGAFWALFALGIWSGMQRYLGGPAPVKLPAIGGAAAVLLMVPLSLVAVVVLRTVSSRWSHVGTSPTLRFSIAATIALLAFGLSKALVVQYPVASLLQFTMATTGVEQVAIFGVFSLAAFGAMYFITPRTSGCDWRSPYLADKHFWFNVYGVICLLGVNLVGGYGQGLAMSSIDPSWGNKLASNPDAPYWLSVVTTTRGYLVARSLAYLFLLVSNVVFFTQIAQMWIGRGRLDGHALQLQSHAGH